jgi:glucose-6-phosphate dehydrogenase assembly protein OpcA
MTPDEPHTVAQIEQELARLRGEEEGGSMMRTSVMTHMGWAPPEWLEAARATLAGLGERHPSRTIVLVPEPKARKDGIEANIDLERFQLGEESICSEVIELRLRGARASAPASIVEPLFIADLPVFLRWRGRPPFGSPELEQLVDVVDRLIVDSAEWPDVPAAFGELEPYFERAAWSDIAWARTLEWRRRIAGLWPGIAELREVRVVGPKAEASLLAGWLRSRLHRDVELEHDEAESLERVAIDGEEVPAPPDDPKSSSDLLSDQLDQFGRDPAYEHAAGASG